MGFLDNSYGFYSLKPRPDNRVSTRKLTASREYEIIFIYMVEGENSTEENKLTRKEGVEVTSDYLHQRKENIKERLRNAGLAPVNAALFAGDVVRNFSHQEYSYGHLIGGAIAGGWAGLAGTGAIEAAASNDAYGAMILGLTTLPAAVVALHELVKTPEQVAEAIKITKRNFVPVQQRRHGVK